MKLAHLKKNEHVAKTGLVVTKPGEKIRLADISTRDSGEYAAKDEVQPRLKELRDQLAELQERLYAENKQSLLIVFQAMDTGGKDGATKNIMKGANAAGVNVTSFKTPSKEELSHDFLWRIHKAAPPSGMIGIWNRSHYEDVLIVRVHNLVPKEVWKTRYEDINNFEQLLANSGVTILKFFLHISKEEQKERLQARLDEPQKHWKFNPGDLKERALWNDYQAAYEDALNKCSTEAAPWLIVPADRKWARDIAILETVVATLEEMNPQYPEVDFDPKNIIIE